MSRKVSLFDSFVEDIIRGSKGSKPLPATTETSDAVEEGAASSAQHQEKSPEAVAHVHTSEARAKEESFLDAFLKKSQSLFSGSRERSKSGRSSVFSSPFARSVLQWQRECAAHDGTSLVLVLSRSHHIDGSGVRSCLLPSSPAYYHLLAAAGSLLAEKHSVNHGGGKPDSSSAIAHWHADPVPVGSVAGGGQLPQQDDVADDLDVAPLQATSSPVCPVLSHPFPSEAGQHCQRVKHRILDFYDRYDPKRCPTEDDVNKIVDSGIPEHALFSYLQTQYGLSAFAVVGAAGACGDAYALSPDEPSNSPRAAPASPLSSDSLDVVIRPAPDESPAPRATRSELAYSWKPEWTELLAPFVPTIEFRASSWNTAPSGSNSKNQFRAAKSEQQCFTFHGVPMVLCHKDLTVRSLTSILSPAGVDVEFGASPRDVPRAADELEALVFAHVALVPAPLPRSYETWIGGKGRCHSRSIEAGGLRLDPLVADNEGAEEEDAVEEFNRASALGTVSDLIAEEILRELDDPQYFRQRQKGANWAEVDDLDCGCCDNGDDGFDDRSVASPVPF